MTVLLTNQVNNQRHKYHPLTVHYHNDSEDDDRSGCRNVSHCHQQFFSELHSPGRSHYTNYINCNTFYTICPLIHTIHHVYKTYGPLKKPLVRTAHDCKTGLLYLQTGLPAHVGKKMITLHNGLFYLPPVY